MSGISSSTGLISGINTAQIIDQLLQIEARPQTLVKQQVLKLQTQQASYLDLNSRIGALKAAAQKLRLNKIFDATTVTSSNSDILTGTTKPGTPAGNYSFLIDRTVSTHQYLSQGFVNRSTSGLGLTAVTLESSQARLDSDIELASLNGGAGIARGKIVVTNRSGTSTTLDLSRASTIGEVLSAFNDNADAKVTASVSGGKLVLTDTSGGSGSLSVRSAAGYTTAASLGIEQSVAASSLTGSNISYLGDNTTLQSLNDGNGIRINPRGGAGATDIHVTTNDGSAFDIDLGDLYTDAAHPDVKTDSAVTTIAQLKARVASQSQGKLTVTTTANGSGIRIVDSTTGSAGIKIRDDSGAATDLGLTTGLGNAGAVTYTGSAADGRAVLAGLNSRLTSTLNGGRGLSHADFEITARDGSSFTFNATINGSVSDYLNSINSATGGKVTASLDANGTSIIFKDTTSGSGNLVLGGAASAELGVFTFGVAQSSVTSHRLNRQYVAESTTLASLNGGRGIGTGSFTIVGANGQSKTVNINDSIKTVGDLLTQIGTDNGIRARINDAGNGIIVEKDPSFTGSDQKITITDTIGAVAKGLNLSGAASATGASNYIDGSFREVVSIAGTDTLDQVVQKINSANAGVSASVVTDGSSGAPYRLKLTSRYAGDTGRFQVESSGLDLGFSLVAQGGDARVFYGSDDPARAILVKRASNTIDGVIDGLSADIKGASSTPVTLTVASDTDSTVQSIQDFVTAFNSLSSKIKEQTAYDSGTQKGGTLLGDSTALSLQSDLFSVIQGTGLGVGGRYRVLAQVGLSVSRDGTIAIDSDKLRNALQTDPSAVAEVFSAFDQTAAPTTVDITGVPGATVNNTNTTPTYTKLGVLEKISQLADRYIDSVSGILTARKKSLDDQISFANDRIADYDTRLAAKKTILETQFAAMESTLAKLQSQQTSISSIAALTTA